MKSLATSIFPALLIGALLATVPAETHSMTPYTAPTGDLNHDGWVDALDIQCMVLVYSRLLSVGIPEADTCQNHEECVLAFGEEFYCRAGFTPFKVCLPACLEETVSVGVGGAPGCDDPDVEDDDCHGFVPKRMVDLNCDGTINSADFLFIVTVVMDEAGGVGTSDHDGDGRLNFCDDDSDNDGDPDIADCADLDQELYNGNLELCDGIDNNCDGVIDDSFPCKLGQFQSTTCGNCGNWSRSCLPNCNWGPWSWCNDPCACECAGGTCCADGCNYDPSGTQCGTCKACNGAGSCTANQPNGTPCADGECVNGVCTCVPDCSGKVCGPNGCGGFCGTCSDGKQCSTGQCVLPPWCPGGGYDDHLAHVAAYWVASGAYGDHWDEVEGALTAGHAAPNLLAGVPEGTRLIVDVVWYLFKPSEGALNPNIEANLNALEGLLDGVEDRVAAFYVFDEPYLDVRQTPRTVLEQGIAALKERFPTIPTYITFAHHCFDPQVVDPACDAMPSNQRGIPANLDLASFDWYSNGSCGTDLAVQFQCHVTDGIDRLEALHDGGIVLTGEAVDLHLEQSDLIEMVHRYFALAIARPQVEMLDFFLWADVPQSGFLGLTSLPELRHVVRGMARIVRGACGESQEMVPVYEWFEESCPDHRYEPGYWEGWMATDYKPTKLAFGLAPEGTGGTAPLYSCPVKRGDCVDYYLTKSANCDGTNLAGPAVVIGGIREAPAANHVPLHRFTSVTWPWDHVYTTDPAWPGVPGVEYNYDWSFGYVLPSSAL